jgi:hypothetical protein
MRGTLRCLVVLGALLAVTSVAHAQGGDPIPVPPIYNEFLPSYVSKAAHAEDRDTDPPPLYGDFTPPYPGKTVNPGDRKTIPPPPTWSPPPELDEAVCDPELARELLAILNETRSPDTFLVTLSMLQVVKVEARLAVPAIIRNAERLRIFKRTNPDQPTEQQKMIVECIAELLKKDREPASNPSARLPEAGSLRAAVGGSLGSATGQPAEPPATTPVPEQPAADPLPEAPAAGSKPATGEIIPGTVKPRTTRPW